MTGHVRRAVFILCAVLLSLAPLARAQDEGPIDDAGPVAMPFTSRSLSSFCKIVGFDKEQTATARTLEKGYRAAYTAETTKVRRKNDEMMKELQDGKGDWEKYGKERGTRVMEYVDTIRKLEAGLLDDLKALCTPAQAAKLPAAARARRRETGFLVALGAGERVDLISMFEAMKIDPHATPALEDVVSRWETDVDRLLIEKDRVIHDGMKSAMDMNGQPDSIEKMKKFMTDLAAICNRVGECNRRAAAEAQALLPDAQQAAFAEEIKLRTFPRIYGPSAANKSFKAALEMKNLSPDQKSRLKDLSEAYTREAAPLNSRWAAAAEEKQRQLASNFMEVMEDNGEKDPADPFYAARKDRKVLDDRYQDKIAEVLAPDQKDQLPKPAPDSHGIPEFLPDFETEFKDQWSQWQGEGG